ncbi:WD40-repeat-containing domain protein [Blyttiomyces helicus]|uniref:WD40-repeat-containing domain protein n=1 Tax=Blyttiomyces helicus TaxID=388810 RepID=A0A4V1IQE3_9FUNG|nr:WD40-repeat-containing domain protein [Blyttiomyces helicus]|eukprot:RKO86257.1 WD40-repeat-containing domain protein [Blyttiomyces helicus]
MSPPLHIRIWDVNVKRQQSQVIFVKSRVPGGKTAITAASYSADGKLIAAGGGDGALRVWGSGGPFLKPIHTIESAHLPGSTTTSVIFSPNSSILATRATDDTVKLWDLRRPTNPLATAPNLPTFFEEASVAFSPSARYLITGTSVKKNEGSGHLVVLDADTLKVVEDIEVGPGSVVRCAWHPKINQILCGMGDGAVQILYDPERSRAGVMLAVVKKKKVRAVDDIDFTIQIINPHALPMYREELPGTGKRKREKIRADPKASRKPDMPLSGPGRGGKQGTNVTMHIMKTIMRDTTRDEDPRDAILKYAEEAAENPYWVAPAYKKNQPDTKYTERVYEDEDEDAIRAAAEAKKRKK